MPTQTLEGFTFYLATGGMATVIDPINVIAGTGSLRLHRNGIAARFIEGEPTGSPKGFSSGIMRALLRPVTAQNGDWLGMIFQKSTADLTAGAGSAYGVGVQVISAGSTAQIQVLKFTAGLGTSTILYSGTTVSFTTSILVALKVTWRLDIARLGGIRVTLERGSASDFSSLTTEYDTVLTTSLLTTSVGEGPALALVTTGSPGDYLWDQTDAVPLIIA
jgi:hypothetical protein